ncbi:MAG: undecaprenyl-diphosphate phosphatase [Magnetococcales bacterium]|nr:undecaprenyl-diphosphate phosphatase [Magnetococcales bacterium]
MEWTNAVILALIQGITEFLPISSSGHLVLAPYLFGWSDQGLMFDIAANTGTLLAVVFYFRRDIIRLLNGLFRSISQRSLKDNEDARIAWALGWATVPVGLAGLTFKTEVATLARDPLVIGVTSILFGLLLWWSDQRGSRNRIMESITWKDVLFIGCAQALALIPGTSRSGVTMTAALFAGLDREAAARFSFLMAVPVGFIAAGLDFKDLLEANLTTDGWIGMSIGLVVSALSAYIVIHWLMSWLRRQTMTVFVVYRLLLGGLIFALVL